MPTSCRPNGTLLTFCRSGCSVQRIRVSATALATASVSADAHAAMNDGKRWKKKLWSKQGRAELEKLALAPSATLCDPLKTSSYLGNVWIRAAIVQGSDALPSRFKVRKSSPSARNKQPDSFRLFQEPTTGAILAENLAGVRLMWAGFVTRLSSSCYSW